MTVRLAHGLDSSAQSEGCQSMRLGEVWNPQKKPHPLPRQANSSRVCGRDRQLSSSSRPTVPLRITGQMMAANFCNGAMGFSNLQGSLGRDALTPWTLTGDLAIFKDELTGVGAPHAQLVKLLGGTKARHTLDRKPKEALVTRAPRRLRKGSSLSLRALLPASTLLPTLTLQAKLQSSHQTNLVPSPSAVQPASPRFSGERSSQTFSPQVSPVSQGYHSEDTLMVHANLPPVPKGTLAPTTYML